MRGLPDSPLESFVRRNPHLYPPAREPIAAVTRHNAAVGEQKTRKAFRVQRSPEEALNKAERRFLVHLRNCNQGTRIGVQDVKVRLGADCWFHPDFSVWHTTGRPCLYDVKAYWKNTGKVRIEDDALVKLKTAAAIHGDNYRFFVAWDEGGIWQIQEVPKG